MQDLLGREINYLRLSVTDRCNLRCRYCMPEAGVEPKPREEILTWEEMARLVEAALGVGFRKVRVTGGEPLVRKGLVDFLARLAAMEGLEDLALTTNGLLLEKLAGQLKEAGLRRVNVSLDTLDPDKFRYITRGGELEQVQRGLRAARQAGLGPLKLNVVAIRGLNDDEILDFGRLAAENRIEVRFIELMPVGESDLGWTQGFLPLAEVREALERKFTLQPLAGEDNGPARSFALVGGEGRVGFIPAVSQHFCGRCNRLRVTADGRLRPCLHHALEVDARTALRAGADRKELAALLAAAVAIKPARHRLGMPDVPGSGRQMSQIGG